MRKNEREVEIEVLPSPAEMVRARSGVDEAELHRLVQTQVAGGWTTEIFRGGPSERTFVFHNQPDTIAVTAIDRCGNASTPVVVERRAQPDAKSPP